MDLDERIFLGQIDRHNPMPIEIPTASWVGQLRQRRVPQDVERFIAGRDRVILVKIHEVGEPAPEEGWLRERSRLAFATTHGSGSIEIFVPLSGRPFDRDHNRKLQWIGRRA
jgi:hypothetical protein